MIKKEIPVKVSSNFEGYNYLSKLNKELQLLDFESIILDFSQNTWFEANLCAALGAIIYEANNRLNDISIEGLASRQKNIFSKNHFLASFGGEKISDNYATTIKYRRNKLTDEKLIKEFLYSELIRKPDFPKLSEGLKKEIIRSIFEIYSNAIIHGDCAEVYSCGQLYPTKTPPTYRFYNC